MSEPSVPIADQLAEWGRRLDQLVKDAPETVVAAGEQLQVENLIAAAVAQLAGEAPPEQATEPSGRAVLAKDLLITVDLVHRALHRHRP